MKPGDVVARRYRLDATAGTGGMGSVFKATDLTTGHLCAVKLIAEAGKKASLTTTRRFVREVRALKDIRHPAVVRYIDDGGADEQQPFLVMDWVGGETLRSRLRSGGATLDETLATVHRLVDALMAIHAAGIVHRDLKPANLMLEGGRFDALRIVDFGIARFSDLSAAVTAGLTKTGLYLGTPGYMAPEQIIQTKSVDGRADVFSVGAVAFEMLTGQRAFAGSDSVALLARMVIEDARPVRRLRPEIPIDIEKLIARLLCRDPARRPHAGPELRAEVEALRARFAPKKLGPPAPVRRADTADTDEEPSVTSVRESSVAGHPRTVTYQVTPQAGQLVGRERELAQLEGCLRPGAVVALWGAVGVGKSRMLLETAGKQQRERPVLFIDARSARDVASVVRAIAVRLNIARLDAGQLQIIRALRAQASMLLVIDGVDAVAEELEVDVARWLEGAPATTVVLSARRLITWAHKAIEVGPLSTRTSDGTSPFASVLLLARAKEAGANISNDDTEAIVALAERLEGNPLSIELAARRLGVSGPRELLALLERPLEVIGRTQTDVYPGTLEEALAFSWDSLSDGERRALGRLALFEGELTLEDATAIVGGEDAVLRLQSIRERSLCTSGPSGDTLSISSAVRDFVRSRAELLDPRGRDAYVRYVVQLGEWLAQRVQRGSDVEALERLAMRTDDLLAISEGSDLFAARAALAVDPALVGRVPASAHFDLLDRAIGLCDEARQPDAAADGQVAEIRGRLACARGRVGALLGRLQSAFTDLAEALAHAERMQDAEGEAAALMEFAVLYHLGGDVAAGEQCCRRVLELRSRFESPRLEARVVGNLGGLAHDAGRLDEAYARYIEAISLAEVARDERLLGVFLGNLAMLDADRGHPAVARSRLLRAIGALGRAGEERLVAITVANLGMVEVELGRADLARASLDRASKVLDDVGDERSHALARARLAAAHALLGDAGAASSSIDHARRLAANDPRTSAILDVFEAFVYLARNDLETARARRDLAFAADATGRDLAAVSDDTRAALRVLSRHLG